LGTESAKMAAAALAASRMESDATIGLGSGSTARLFLEALAERVASGDLGGVVGVATSTEIEEAARDAGIRVASLEEAGTIDVAVDGADEVDPDWNLIKGRGGAFFRERLVARAALRYVVVVDDSKLVARLGETAPVPVEVKPLLFASVTAAVADLGGEAVRRRAGRGIYFTDQGNCVLDCAFGPIDSPARLARDLEAVPEILAHGLFVGMVDELIVGSEAGAEIKGVTGKEAGS